MQKMIRRLYLRIHNWKLYKDCYKKMESRGIAVFGMCFGPREVDGKIIESICCECRYYTPLEEDDE